MRGMKIYYYLNQLVLNLQQDLQEMFGLKLNLKHYGINY